MSVGWEQRRQCQSAANSVGSRDSAAMSYAQWMLAAVVCLAVPGRGDLLRGAVRAATASRSDLGRARSAGLVSQLFSAAGPASSPSPGDGLTPLFPAAGGAGGAPSASYVPPSTGGGGSSSPYVPPSAGGSGSSSSYVPPSTGWGGSPSSYVPPSAGGSGGPASNVSPSGGGSGSSSSYVPPSTGWGGSSSSYVPPSAGGSGGPASNVSPSGGGSGSPSSYVPPSTGWGGSSSSYVPPSAGGSGSPSSNVSPSGGGSGSSSSYVPPSTGWGGSSSSYVPPSGGGNGSPSSNVSPSGGGSGSPSSYVPPSPGGGGSPPSYVSPSGGGSSSSSSLSNKPSFVPSTTPGTLQHKPLFPSGAQTGVSASSTHAYPSGPSSTPVASNIGQLDNSPTFLPFNAQAPLQHKPLFAPQAIQSRISQAISPPGTNSYPTAPSGGAASAGNDVEVVSQTFSIDVDGNYEYSFQQTDGTAVQETGVVTPGNEPETGSLASTGSYQFTADDGIQYSVQYTADQGGFQPVADHLPQPPAQIPEYQQLRDKYPALFWAERLRVQSPQ